MQPSGHVEASTRLLSAMLRERESIPRAVLLARQAAEMVSDGAAVVYVLDSGDPPDVPPVWTSKATAGEIHLEDPTVPADSGTLGTLAQEQQPILLSGAELTREDYAHLHARRTLVSLAYVPIIVNDVLIGAVEVASFESTIDASELQTLVDLVEHAGPGLVSGMLYEDERNSLLESVSRLTQLYDLEKVFSSTLEMDELQPLIASKIREVLDVQAVNLWFVKDEHELLLMRQSGNDPTAAEGSSERTGEGYIAEVSDSNEPLLIDDDKDERLARRNPSAVEGGPFSVIVCPLVAHEKQVGIIEAINKLDGTPFDDDHLFLLNSISETAAIALTNAGLLQAERKVEVLQTLVQVSGEITSTLNLDRVLEAVVNHTQAIIAFERAAIALEQRGALQLKAVSGMTQINRADPAVSDLQKMLEWASISNEETHVTQHGDQIDDPRPETQAKFAAYFSATGMRAFYALPLIDDQGRLGVLSFESSDPDFLAVAHLEIIKVLAGQATVALRNASLYREVPFINLLEPLLQRKRRFLAMEKWRRGLMIALGAALGLFLIFCPLPMRVSGEATVAPARTARVQAGVDGVVRNVYIHEGEYVKEGAALAELEDWNYRADVAAAEARYSEAMATMNRALSQNDGTLAGTEQVKVGYFKAELTRARELLDRTTIRAPFNGVVTTPEVQNFVGRRLMHGDTFAELMETSHVTVDVAVPEDDATLLRSGEPVSIKLESFPLQTFRGDVAVISPESELQAEHRVFIARVNVPNNLPNQQGIRPGMQGHGKVSVGWHPAGYVLFRGAAMWIWSKLWSWFGW